MANIEHYIPFCIKHEAHVKEKNATETCKDYFERARGKGYTKDTGGCTQTGLTLDVFRKLKPEATASDLKNVSYEDWLSCMKRYFWDRISGDQIKSQSVADAIMDFFWNAGYNGTRAVQSVLGVKVDGIIGKKSIAAINSRDPFDLWAHIQSARYDYYQSRVKANPEKYKKYLAGWLNRLEAIRYED